MKQSLDNKENTLVITRIFNAPLEKVWQAWTNPEMTKKWWGPKDFTAPQIEIDFKVGGKYLFCMKGPDEKEYWSTGIYKEIVLQEKIIMTDSFADEKGNVVSSEHYGMKGMPLELKVALNLKKLEDGKTEMTLEHYGFPEGSMAELARQGWNQSFDKMEENLLQ